MSKRNFYFEIEGVGNKSSWKLAIILEQSMEYTSIQWRKTERSQHVTGRTWKHWDFDWLCSKNLPGHRSCVAGAAEYMAEWGGMEAAQCDKDERHEVPGVWGDVQEYAGSWLPQQQKWSTPHQHHHAGAHRATPNWYNKLQERHCKVRTTFHRQSPSRPDSVLFDAIVRGCALFCERLRKE